MSDNIILTGIQNGGKTTKLLSLYQKLKERNVSVGGFAAPGIWENDQKIGFNLLNLQNGQSSLLATIIPNKDFIKLGKFYFNPETLNYGNKILKDSLYQDQQITFIDEIGKFELMGFMWHDSFEHLLKINKKPLIAVVRAHLLTQIMKNYQLNTARVFVLNSDDNLIINRLLNRNHNDI